VTTTHRQVRVRANGMDARVDAGLADLIRECWRTGIPTIMSCENQGKMNGSTCDMAWLYLWAAAGERLLDIVTDGLLGSGIPGMFARIHHTCDLEDKGTEWQYEVQLRYPAGLRLALAIRFPVEDIPLITERLRTNNRTAR
jgi:hypothetical protein